MPFNVSAFRGQMVGDGARPNLFECTIDGLDAVANLPNGGSKFRFMCRAAQLPGSTIGAVPVNYFGRELKFAGNRTFTEWTVTIINDEDFTIRNAFEKWMSRLNSHVGNIRDTAFNNPKDYQVDAEIVQYGKTGDKIKAYKFIGMFPIDLTPIEMDWAANDSIEEYAVTFAYQWWESIGPIVATTDSDSGVRTA